MFFYNFVFFFFQAEDGIRDIGVTGVQTCALPISGRTAQRRAFREEIHHPIGPQSRYGQCGPTHHGATRQLTTSTLPISSSPALGAFQCQGPGFVYALSLNSFLAPTYPYDSFGFSKAAFWLCQSSPFTR